MRTIRVGIIGFGTVGAAVAEIIASHGRQIEDRCGARLVVAAVCRRSPIGTGAVPAGARASQDWRDVVSASDVHIVIETVGGIEVANEIVVAALERGKAVVTANKNLLAARGEPLLELAARRNLPIGFEAAVAGGIPVIRALAEGNAADRVRAVYGILNGTANFILTRMEREGAEFADALAEAQRLGYAEADPTMDVDGLDVRDKLAILARLAFGGRVQTADIATTGIRAIEAIDMVYARRLDSAIRLVGSAEMHDGAAAIRVRPWLVDRRSMLAKVEGVYNAVFVEGERVGTQMFYGRGAGGDATAIAVLSDLMEIAADLARGRESAKVAAGFRDPQPLRLSTAPPPVPWYLRFVIRDHPGVLARLAGILAAHDININFLLQEPDQPKDRLPFVITLEPVSEPVLLRAVAELDASGALQAPVLPLRMGFSPSIG